MRTKLNLKQILPVFLVYVVMGFVDVVGVSTGYVQKDFSLSDTMAQLLPAMVFIWFFVFSIPIGILQDRIGKKSMTMIGIAVSFLGLILPFFHYSYILILIAFIGIGIGNTIIQVAANPLLQEVTPQVKFSSFLSLSQFIKAIVSLLGPIIATFMALHFGHWRLVFLVYAVLSILSGIWLYSTPIQENIKSAEPATFSSCFGLLKDRFMLAVVVAIFLIVGADVGMNTNIQGLLQKLHGISLERASYGISIYFTALMVSRFAGAVMLQFVKPVFFLTTTTVLAMLGIFVLWISGSETMAFTGIFIVGLGAGNLFPLVFSIALEKLPTRANEISGLLIMAIVGGAIIPPVIAAAGSSWGVAGNLLIILLCFAYITLLPLINTKRNLPKAG